MLLRGGESVAELAIIFNRTTIKEIQVMDRYKPVSDVPS